MDVDFVIAEQTYLKRNPGRRDDCRFRGHVTRTEESDCKCGDVPVFDCAYKQRESTPADCRLCNGYEPILISVCINTHNEGPRLRATVQAFHNHLASHPHEFIIIADGVTDGCCDDLDVISTDVRVEIIHNVERKGCGRAKGQAIEAARGDVLIFLDAHMNVLSGQVARMARRAFAEDSIFTPVIRNIKYAPNWTTEIVGDGQNQIPYAKGMRFEKHQYRKRHDNWLRANHLSETRMVGVGFAISRKTLNLIGGFNAYHGLHGSQERGISLRAFMAQVPVKLDSSVIMGHEFRAGQKKPKGFKRIGARDQSKNFWHAYFVVAGDEAWPEIARVLPSKAHRGNGIVKCNDIKSERDHFQQNCKRRSDADLLRMLGLAQPDSPKVDKIAGIPTHGMPVKFVQRWRKAMALGIIIIQHPLEMVEVWKAVANNQPSAMVEIGSETGGALYVYAGACAPGARIVAVDVGATTRTVENLPRAIQELQNEGFDANWVKADSHHPRTIQLVRNLAGDRIGFLHIDGDHTRKGVSADHATYSPLVIPGGIIALHDAANPQTGVPGFWKSLDKTGHEAALHCAGKLGEHIEMGIGMIRIGQLNEDGKTDAKVCVVGGDSKVSTVDSKSPTSSDAKAPQPQLSAPKIDVHIAYEPGGQIGADYNRIMRESPHEWVLFLDHDVLMLHPSWYEVCQRAIREHPRAGLLTCWTNNIACKHQKDLGAPAGHDIAAHRARAKALWEEHGFHCTRNARWLIAGFFMLTSKAAWKAAGGFPEDSFFGVDNEYDRRIRRRGFETWRMDGLYCYHIRERQDGNWIEGVATSATLAKKRTRLEIKRSTAPVPGAPPEPQTEPPKPAPEAPKRKCIYTALTGGYDRLLRQPKAPGWDYIAFCDEPPAQTHGWEIRPFASGELDPLRASRMPKLLPHKFLCDYDYSLYIDANMVLRASPEMMATRARWPDFCNVKHPWRRCIYDELKAIGDRGKAPEESVLAQSKRYRADGMPDWRGMTENGCMLRRHNAPEVIALDEAWWHEYIRSETGRDQPALAFTLWRLQKEVQTMSATERTRWVKIRPHRKVREDAAKEPAQVVATA